MLLKKNIFNLTRLKRNRNEDYCDNCAGLLTERCSINLCSWILRKFRSKSYRYILLYKNVIEDKNNQ